MVVANRQDALVHSVLMVVKFQAVVLVQVVDASKVAEIHADLLVQMQMVVVAMVETED